MPFVSTAGPTLERKADIAAYPHDLEDRATSSSSTRSTACRARSRRRSIPAMEDRQLPITLGAGPGAQVVTLDLPRFTLVGATTRAGLLTSPLRDRFGIQHRLDLYAPGRPRADRRAQRRDARRRRSTRPGRARSPTAPAERRASPTACSSACATSPRSAATARSRGGGRRRARPAGRRRHRARPRSTARSSRSLRAVRGRTGRPLDARRRGRRGADTIEDVYEPYLLQRGLPQRTPRGRCATLHAFRHLGLEPPAEPTPLF